MGVHRSDLRTQQEMPAFVDMISNALQFDDTRLGTVVDGDHHPAITNHVLKQMLAN